MTEFDFLTCSKRLKKLHRESGLTFKKIAEEIGVSEQLLKNYEAAALNGGICTGVKSDKTRAVAGMRIETLVKLANIYNVSADYILGLTNQPTPSTNTRAICDYTGLSESSVELLHKYNWSESSWYPELAFTKEYCGCNLEAKVINTLLDDSQPENATPVHRPILKLLAFFLDYCCTTNHISKVNTHGQISEEENFERKDGLIKFSNLNLSEIVLNPRIIENAVLMEIQQALISLKQELKDGKDGKNNGKC